MTPAALVDRYAASLDFRPHTSPLLTALQMIGDPAAQTTGQWTVPTRATRQ